MHSIPQHPQHPQSLRKQTTTTNSDKPKEKQHSTTGKGMRHHNKGKHVNNSQ